MNHRQRKLLPVHLLLAAFALLAAGCAPVVRNDQPAFGSGSFLLREGETAGQTFVARHRGLSGLILRLVPASPGSGYLTLTLFDSPDADRPLATDTLDLSEIASPGEFAFTFPPLEDSTDRYYYARLTLTGSGAVEIPLAPGDAYIDGVFYAGAVPQDAQSAFASSYSLRQAALGLAGESVSWAWYALVAAFLFILPGWALGAWLPGLVRFGFWIRLAFSAAFSLAVYALVFLGAWLIGLPIGPWAAWGIPLSAGGVMITRLFRARSRLRLQPRPRAADIALAGVLVLLWISRIAAVRTCDLPMWGDGIGHTINTQLVIDHGGIFSSWLPYADIATFTYHFGFHVSAALWHWVTGQDAAASVLQVGQVFNVLAVLALYPLAARLGRSAWAGVVAVIVGGLASSIPMMFADWGRYTQLTGEILAPAVLAGALLLQTRTRFRWPWRIAVAVLWAGLAVSHYRVLLGTVAVLPVILFPMLLHRSRWIRLRNLAISGALGLLLAGPWLAHSFAGRNPQYVERTLTKPVTTAIAPEAWWSALRFLIDYYPSWLWGLCALGLLAGAVRKPRAGVAVAAALGLLFLVSNPSLLRLPGSTLIDPFAVACGLFIPIAIGVGLLAGCLAPFVARRRWASAAAAVLLLAAAAAGANHLRGTVRPPVYALGTQPDLRAAAWIRENLPADSRFLIPSFYSPSHKAYAGTDGGWWLPWLTARQVDVWPLNVNIETANLESSPGGLYAMAAVLSERGIGDPATLRRMDDWGIRYVYIGQRRGAVNNPGPSNLTPEALEASGCFRLIYAQDRVRIYERLAVGSCQADG